MTARLLGDIGVAGLRKKREADAALSRAEAQRGTEYHSRSGHRFRAAVVAEPKRDGKHVDGTQLLLALCDLHEKPAKRRRADRDRTAVLADLEARGADALEEQPAPPACRAKCSRLSEVLVYESMGGEVLETELRGLTPGEASYIRSHSHALRFKRPVRRVTWPSQSSEAIVQVIHSGSPETDHCTEMEQAATR